ncbi:fibronectin type III domain-containing protein 3B isoform X1, partial [Tachysurus ichikawai]
GVEFQVVYTGVDLSSRVEGLSRNTQYRFRLMICSAEWRSSPSSILVCQTSVDKPGPPAAPRVSAITSHGFCVSWEPPHDDGGSGDLSYLLEISEENSGAVSQWVVMYRGPQREHVCKDLKAATQYSVRISTQSAGGHSQYTDSLVVCTLSLPPGPCHNLTVKGSIKHREVSLQW